MASFDPEAPDRDSPDYQSYLVEKIDEEEQHLKSLQDKCKLTAMEEQLMQLRLQSVEFEGKQTASPLNSVGAVQATTG